MLTLMLTKFPNKYFEEVAKRVLYLQSYTVTNQVQHLGSWVHWTIPHVFTEIMVSRCERDQLLSYIYLLYKLHPTDKIPSFLSLHQSVGRKTLN